MRSGIKFTAVAAALLLLTAGSQGAFANCTNFGAGFPIYQCGFGGWFAAPPAAAGTVQPVWWQINYGNLAINTGLGGGGALEGTGNSAPGTFNGNDSGLFSMVLSDAATVLYNYTGVPAGALCSNFENSWSQTGVDGCSDVVRTTADNDDLLNPFFGPYGPSFCAYGSTDPYYTLNKQIDYPTAVMLQESTGKFFALACVANKSRGATSLERCEDTSEGFFDLATVVNGAANPVFTGRNNVIPWQPVPKPNVDSVSILAPGGTTGQRMLSLSWPNVVVHNDGSIRPSTRAGMVNPGVGCLDMGNLVRFVLESAPITTATPDPAALTWTPLQTIAAPTGPTVTASATVNPDTALRVRTLLGKTPRTTSTTAANCRLGSCGDLGVEAAPPNTAPLTIIGGALVSQKVVDVAASKDANEVRVTFRTTSETSVDSISVLAIDKKGESVVRQIGPQQGTTGVGADYSVTLRMSDLKGARQIAVRLDGGGSLIDKSAPVSIR